MEQEDKQEIMHEAQQAYKEAKSAIHPWNGEANTDVKFYLSDQWDEKDSEKLKKKGVPVLNLNYIKKSVDMLSGYQRQNRGDIKYFPIEGGDELVSQVLSKIAHWVMKNNNSRYYVSEAFKDCLMTGIGWFYPVIDYSKDPVNGDIFIRQESPFNMLFDPYFTEADFSDCDYIIRHKLLSYRKAVELWPEYKKEIEEQKGATSDNSFRNDANVPSGQGNQVLVWEYWRREYVPVKFAINIESGDIREIEDEEAEELEISEAFDVIEKRMPRMKLAVIVGENTEGGGGVVVYDGDSPYSTQDYPFIPVFCYLTNSYPYWEKKLQGIVRTLRDPQREKNKRRSQIMHILNSVATSGYDIEKGAYDDINSFNTGGAGKVRLRNPGRNPAMRLEPPQMPAAFITLEQMFDQDIDRIGANPDLLGMINEKGAAGITIQLRQKQGMTAMQEVFDNLSMGVQKFGRMLVELIVGNYSKSKIERILGEEVPFKNDIAQMEGQIKQMTQQIQQMSQDVAELSGREVQAQEGMEKEAMAQVEQMNMQEQQMEDQVMQMTAQLQQMQQQLQMLQAAQEDFWKRWDDLEVNSRYDCTVSETMESETYRISVLSAITQAQQYGVPVPPELFMEYLDLPKEDKSRMMEYSRQQQEAAAAVKQAEIQSKVQIEQMKIQGKMAGEGQKMKNSKDIALINQGIVNPDTVQ